MIRCVNHWRRLMWALLALALIVVIGTIGYVVLGFAPIDALYQTVTTVSTVGFREVEPLDGLGQVFTMLLILGGVGTTLYALTVLIETVVEGRLREVMGRRRMDKTIESLQDHVIVCGWGRTGRSIALDLSRSGADQVVIEMDPTRAAGCPYPVIEGDATDDEVLRRAGIERANALIAGLDSDAANLFVTVSARALCPELFIVSRVRTDAAEDKLHRGGANRVVNPQSIGGSRMAAMVLQPNVAAFVDVVMHEHDVEYRLGEVPVVAGSPLSGETLRSAHIRDRSGALVLACRASTGVFMTNPPPETEISVGDVLIAIGTPTQLDDLGRLARV